MCFTFDVKYIWAVFRILNGIKIDCFSAADENCDEETKELKNILNPAYNTTLDIMFALEGWEPAIGWWGKIVLLDKTSLYNIKI